MSAAGCAAIWEEMDALMAAAERDNEHETIEGSKGIRITARLRSTIDRLDAGALTNAKRNTEATVIKSHDTRWRTRWML